MAFDEKLASRIRIILKNKKNIVEKDLFGTLCFMFNGNMLCCADNKSQLIIRVGSKQYDKALTHKHAREMDFTGTPLKGLVHVSFAGISNNNQLSQWINMGLQFTSSLPGKLPKRRMRSPYKIRKMQSTFLVVGGRIIIEKNN